MPLPTPTLSVGGETLLRASNARVDIRQNTEMPVEQHLVDTVPC